MADRPPGRAGLPLLRQAGEPRASPIAASIASSPIRRRCRAATARRTAAARSGPNLPRPRAGPGCRRGSGQRPCATLPRRVLTPHRSYSHHASSSSARRAGTLPAVQDAEADGEAEAEDPGEIPHGVFAFPGSAIVGGERTSSSVVTLPNSTLYTRRRRGARAAEDDGGSSMTQSVMWLDDAFQTVRLEAASIELGRITGNIDRPTVEMMPRTPSDEPRRRQHPSGGGCPASRAPARQGTGAMSIHG